MRTFKQRTETKLFTDDGGGKEDKASISQKEWMDITFKINNMNLEFNNIKSVFNEKTIMKINET